MIDDVYSMVGSPNINYRSHTSDAELASAVVDEGEIVQTPDDLNVTKGDCFFGSLVLVYRCQNGNG